jgi:hypothetical protein
MIHYQCKSAILFHLFNRLDVSRRVLKVIKKVRPNKLYLSIDGPRNKEDIIKILSIKKFLKKQINWNCKVIRLYNKLNLGPKFALLKSINYFFSKEERGIILEHDCLPSISFFRYCDELLEYYKYDSRVKLISGNFFYKKKPKDSYYFSRSPSAHGFATWKRTWKEYDSKMRSFKRFFSFFWLLLFFKFNIVKAHHFYKNFNLTKKNKIITWDYQLVYSIWKNNGYIIKPCINLCKHIGWGKETYNGTEVDSLPEITTHEMKFPIKHPIKFFVNKDADNYDYKRLRRLFFFRYIINKIKSKLFKR